jgi:hypothetical protein
MSLSELHRAGRMNDRGASNSPLRRRVRGSSKRRELCPGEYLERTQLVPSCVPVQVLALNCIERVYHSPHTHTHTHTHTHIWSWKCLKRVLSLPRTDHMGWPKRTDLTLHQLWTPCNECNENRGQCPEQIRPLLHSRGQSGLKAMHKPERTLLPTSGHCESYKLLSAHRCHPQ